MKSFEETPRANLFTERFGAGKMRLQSFSDAVRFDVDCSGSVCLLHVNGAVDIFNSPELEAKIADLGREQQGAILVSFALCSFVDCSCLRILIRQFKLLGERLLIVAPPTTALYRILDLTRLAKVLPVHAGLREAFRAIESPERPERFSTPFPSTSTLGQNQRATHAVAARWVTRLGHQNAREMAATRRIAFDASTCELIPER